MNRALLALLVLIAAPSFAAKPPRVEFTRMIAHWAEYGDDDYLDFVKDARPEVCQIGFYGGHFYSLAHTPQYKGYPAHFPVQGIPECGKWFEQRNAAIHKLGAKVIGHFNVEFLIGEPEGKDGPRGFFKFYRELWDEKELGPKPVADPLELMARNADGTPMAASHYSVGQMHEYTACLNNPAWRTVLKAWLKRGIGRGCDGFIANYFYRHNCLCQHCQKGFRSYLAERFKPQELQEKFGIADLAKHEFKEIVGWHKPEESTPFRREMLRFSQISCKNAFDEVFIDYGRKLKPDLIVAQWDHLGDFGQISLDERCMLPTDRWGKGEDYLWYSTGASACYTDLAAGHLGEGTLHARYIRGAFEDKPFTLGKYESTRIRVAIAELAANGGAAMGFYTRFKDPEARKEIVRYYNFLEANDAILKANHSHAEILLLYPRSRVHQGDVAIVEQFKAMGTSLLDLHVLFDVAPDDLVDPANRAKYQLVLKIGSDEWPTNLSTFEAPKTVRVSASRPATGVEIDLHFVNYDREEPAKKKSPGSGIKDEKSRAARDVKANFILPKGKKAVSVRIVTPESPKPVDTKFSMKDGRVQFAVPEFLVYAIARIELANE
jgi:hypothetical protein